MNDSRDLKAIAEACQQHQLLRFMRSHGALYIRNDNGIVFDVHQNRSFPEFMAQNKDYADLVLAANPETILAMIAENERLKTLRSVTERDLAQELEVWRHGPSCWNCGDTGDVHDMVGEWLGQCDCNAAKLIDISSERDQLRAEVAGLKTGYEAYERVNAELKAEVGALRKDAERYRWLRDSDYAGKILRDMGAKYRADADQRIDAALGQGEQS